MASIYPIKFISNPSEKLVFDAFEKLQYPEITVYHSRNYLNRNLEGNFFDGEIADFLVIHPKKGMIFFESKNINNLSYNRDEACWYDGNRPLTTDPIEQAKIHKKNFFRKLKEETKLNISLPAIHAVIFPKTPKPIDLKEFRFDTKPELILWKEDFLNLRSSLDEIFNLQPSEKSATPQELNTLHSMLMGKDIKNPIGIILNELEKDQNIKLSEQQEFIMSAIFYPGNKKIAVNGLAGTGKTILLAKRAVDQVNTGKKVLVLTKTKPVNKFLKLLTKIEKLDLTITNVDQFPKIITEKAHIDQYRNLRPSSINNYSSTKSLNEEDVDKRIFFDEKLPNYCFEIFNNNPEKKYDLILIDEAQDFHKNWFEVLCFAKKEDGQIVFFYDPFQEQISNSMVSEIEKAEDVAKFPLNQNFRNTIEITNFLQKLIVTYFPSTKVNYSFTKENGGEKPILIEINDWDDQVQKVCKTIRHLINVEKIFPKHIAVIYDGSLKKPENGNLYMHKEISAITPCITAEEYAEPYLNKAKEHFISLDSIRRFKGLEKRVVILTNIEVLNKETAKNLYTGLSRARTKLIIIAKKDVINQIQNLI